MRWANQVEKGAYRYLTVFMLLVIAVGIAFYHFVEKFTWLNSYYFCIVTLSTVGYGDITPKTAAGKLFTTFYIIIGIGIFATFISVRFKRSAEAIQRRRENKSSKNNK